jgi:hypothetical protein
MKKSTFFAVLWFALAFSIVSMSSCSTHKKGYNYSSHYKKAAKAKPSKCYEKHNKW